MEFDKIVGNNFEHRRRQWPEGQDIGKYFAISPGAPFNQ